MNLWEQFSNFGAKAFGGRGLLGEGEITPEQQQLRNLAGNQGILSAAAALLQARDTPGATLGGALGNALAAGQQGFQGGLNAAMQRQALGARSGYLGALTKGKEAEMDLANRNRRREQEILGQHGAVQTPLVSLAAFPAAADSATVQTQPLQPSAQVAEISAGGPANRLSDPARLIGIANQLTLSGQPERAAQYLQIAQAQIPEGVDPTTLMRNAEAAGYVPGTPEYQQFIKDQLAKSGQTINIDTAGSAFDKEFGRQNAQQFFAHRDAAQKAADGLASNQEALALLDRGVISGFGANAILGIGKALQQAGINLADDPIANTEAFVASRARQIGTLIEMFGAGTGLSDADREFATKAAAGDITMTEASLRRIIEINDRASRNVIKRYNQEAQAIDPSLSPYPLNVELPKPPAGGSSTGIKILGIE